MNALQMGLIHAKVGLTGLHVGEFLKRWADAGDAETALDAVSPRGRKAEPDRLKPESAGECDPRR